MIRHSYLLYSSPLFLKFLIVFRVFTSFYAGLNSIFETDFKKLIALSTLRHLGFICLSFSVGLIHLSFFHILTHALFKSLLFIAIGDIIINLNHSQDRRYLSSGLTYTPFSCFIINISLSNLLGLPNLRGFFSKDLVLEIFRFSNSSVFLFFLVFLNLFFTYFYSYKLFSFSFQSTKINPYQNFHSPQVLHSFLLFSLSLISLFFGHFFLTFIIQ
jgi:NADH:ubiquinone oxidoreductase subunit 5 (subunit L)/multisubunit Na+/H+ antiporter MnhA subunit